MLACHAGYIRFNMHRRKHAFLVVLGCLVCCAIVKVAHVISTRPTGLVVHLRYDANLGNGFFVALHNPDVDRVVSKGILERGAYESVDEMHCVCKHIGTCKPGATFVEVGSALGMVSVYAAKRGMHVHAFDPLQPNIELLQRSLRLNRLSARTYCALVGAVPNRSGTWVESEPHNMAATIRGGGDYGELVSTVTLDGILNATLVDLMLLTCQGCELEALIGAGRMLASGRIRHLIWRRHYLLPVHDQIAEVITRLLIARGYRLYDIEVCSFSYVLVC